MNKCFLLSLVIAVSFAFSCTNPTKDTHIKTELDATEIIAKLSKKQNVEYIGKTITNKFDLTLVASKYTKNPTIEPVEINGVLTFIDCIFKDSIIGFKVNDNYANILVFNKPITFINCTFEKPVLLRQAEFEKDVEFSNCIFEEDLQIEGSNFNSRNVYFRENTFNGEVKFTSTDFYGNVTFMSSVFANNAAFNNCFYNRNANFGACSFTKNSNFGNSEFRGYFKITYCVFLEKTYIKDCIFDGKIEAVKVNSKKDFVFSNNLCYSNTNFNKSAFSEKISFNGNIFFTDMNEFEGIKISEDCSIENVSNKKILNEVIDFNMNILVEEE